MMTNLVRGMAGHLRLLVAALALGAGAAQAAPINFTSGNLSYGINCSGPACAGLTVSQYGANGIAMSGASGAPLVENGTINLYITVTAISGTIGSWSGLLVDSIAASMGGNIIFPAPNDVENAFLFLDNVEPRGTISFQDFQAPVTSLSLDNFDLLALEGRIGQLVFAPTLVPEPASLAAFATALAGLGVFGVRRGRRGPAQA